MLERGKTEMRQQVNHLGTSLLSLLLLPSLNSTAKKTGLPSRLTIVGSEVHFWTPFRERKAASILTRLDEKDAFRKPGIDRYCVSKLLNVLWTRELANRVNNDNVIINCVSPGLCATSLHRTEKGLSVSSILTYLIAFSSVQGAHMVTNGVIFHDNEHGGYLSEQRLTRCVLAFFPCLVNIVVSDTNSLKPFAFCAVEGRQRDAEKVVG